MAIWRPPERVAKAAPPRAIPVCGPVAGSGWAGTSAQAIATYQPAASRLSVTVLGVPSSGRDEGRLVSWG